MANIQEVWKDILGYEGYYQISNLGRVKSLERKIQQGIVYRFKPETILIPKFERYYFVNLAVNGKQKTHRIHRLIAESFIPNPNNYPIINHIDGNKQNNSLSNLEWCNNSHNIKEAYSIGLNKGCLGRSGKVHAQSKKFLHKPTGKFFYGYGELSKEFKYSPSFINSMILGKRKNTLDLIEVEK